MRRHCFLASIASLWVTLLTGQAHAQTAAPSAEIAEVVVTAQRIESTVQRTPAAVTVVDPAAMSRQQIVQLRDLNSVLPNAVIVPVVDALQISIRGIGSTFIDPRADPAVAASVNGLFYDRALPAGFGFLDVARVEVVNGPQGTLYGRNAAAGALNIVTNQPSNQFGGMVEAGAGNLHENNVTAVLNLPLGDNFAVRFAFARDYRQGYLDHYYNDINTDTYRISAKWTPTDKLTFYLESNYLATDGYGEVSTPWPCSGATAWSLFVPVNCAAGVPAPGATIPKGGQTGTFVASDQLHVDYDFDWATLSSISGFVGTHSRYYGLPNGIYFNVTELANSYDYSEEIRLTGNDKANHQGGLGWQLGSYLFTSSGNYYVALSNPAYGPPTTYSHLPQSSEAGYAQASYGLTDSLRLTAGLRYTHDYKSLTDRAVVLSTSSDHTNYKAGLEYDLAQNNMLYANVSSGYVAGGINAGDPSVPTRPGFASPFFRPETITAYEIGSKNKFLDTRLLLNGDFYYYDFHNYQYTEAALVNNSTVPGAPQLVVDNAGSVTTYGVELNSEFALTSADRLSASVTYAHGTFGALNFVRAVPHLPFVPYPIFPGSLSIPSGSPLVNIPQWSALLGYEHTWRLNGGSSLAFSINSKISDKYHLIPGSTAVDDVQNSYTMTDASLSFHWPEDHYVLRAWIKNIENSPVNAYGQTLSFQNYGILPPRTYGATVTARF